MLSHLPVCVPCPPPPASDVPAIQPTGDTLTHDLPADFSTTAGSFRASVALCGAALLRSLQPFLDADDSDLEGLLPLLLHAVDGGGGAAGATAAQLRAVVRYWLRSGLTDEPVQLAARAPTAWLAWQLKVQ